MNRITVVFLILAVCLGFFIRNLRLSPRSLASISLHDVELPNGKLVTLTFQKGRLMGSNLKNARLKGNDVNGKSIDLQIIDEGFDGKVATYTIEYRTSRGTWKKLCPDTAYLIDEIWEGRTNPAVGTTVVCASSTLGKCLRWGYAPWETWESHSLRPYFHACVHMVRADYLGDGTSYTIDGVPIFFTDNLGINGGVAPDPMTLEATWDAQGAITVAHPRRRQKTPNAWAGQIYHRPSLDRKLTPLLSSYSNED